MATDGTTIWVSDELWEELNRRKKRGDSFQDVILRLLDSNENSDG